MKSRAAILIALLLAGPRQDVIRLYPGPAPGSENWTHEEKEYFSPICSIRKSSPTFHSRR